MLSQRALIGAKQLSPKETKLFASCGEEKRPMCH